ncbi:MAG: proline--tRNA ligase [Acidobacteriota bacterium]
MGAPVPFPAMAIRWNTSFFPTLREDPAEVETTSHRLLLRAGYIRQLAAGLYSLLPLAQRCVTRISAIVREEMNRIGGQEFYLPALHPADLWRETGRYDVMGDIMFRLQDRGHRDMVLGVTHEEVFTAIARDELRSYRQLPQIWYQLQPKFRDEPRARSGLLRVRQFTMKDAYSFDIDAAGLDISYDKHAEAYHRIFSRCGLQFVAVEAHSGAMGGSSSQEFMVRSPAGEDDVAACTACDHAANLEKADSRLAPVEDPPAAGDTPARVDTPGRKTIAEIAAFLDWPASRQIKTLVYVAGDEPVLALLRGDHALNETKLSAALSDAEVRPAAAEEIAALMGADAGSLGPVGAPAGVRLLADEALRGRTNMACGANVNDVHLAGVTPGRDFEAAWADLRTVQEGEACVRCGAKLEVFRSIEIGHIFKLGTKYSASMGATVLDEHGKAVPIVMGSYGIGVERILASAVELYADEAGIVLPPAIAPFGCLVVLLAPADAAQQEAAGRLTGELESAGIEVLIDDRRERPGVKFKDSELIGIPARVVLGRGLAGGTVEVTDRRRRHTQETAVEAAAAAVRDILDRPGGA